MEPAADLSTWISVIQLPSGRQLFALNAALSAATKANLEPVLAVIAKARAVTRAAFDLEEGWARSDQRTGEGAALTAADNALDGLVGGLFQSATQALKLITDAGQLGQAQACLRELFPTGPLHVTAADIPTELERAAALVRDGSTKWADSLRALNVAHWLPAIGAATKRLDDAHAAARAPKPSGVTWDQVVAAQRQSSVALREFIARVLGLYHDESKAHVDARFALLTPVHEQLEAVRAEYRRGRATSDVTPDGAPRGPATTPSLPG